MTEIDVGDLVVNLRWPHYGMCLVVAVNDEKVQVHHQENPFSEKPGFSWDYARNWVKIDQKKNKKRIKKV